MSEYKPESKDQFFVMGIAPVTEVVCRLEELKPGDSWAERLKMWRTPGNADPFEDIHVARVRTTVTYSRMHDTAQKYADPPYALPKEN